MQFLQLNGASRSNVSPGFWLYSIYDEMASCASPEDLQQSKPEVCELGCPILPCRRVRLVRLQGTPRIVCTWFCYRANHEPASLDFCFFFVHLCCWTKRTMLARGPQTELLLASLSLASKASDTSTKCRAPEHVIRETWRSPDYISKIAQHALPRLSLHDTPWSEHLDMHIQNWLGCTRMYHLYLGLSGLTFWVGILPYWRPEFLVIQASSLDGYFWESYFPTC